MLTLLLVALAIGLVGGAIATPFVLEMFNEKARQEQEALNLEKHRLQANLEKFIILPCCKLTTQGDRHQHWLFTTDSIDKYNTSLQMNQEMTKIYTELTNIETPLPPTIIIPIIEATPIDGGYYDVTVFGAGISPWSCLPIHPDPYTLYKANPKALYNYKQPVYLRTPAKHHLGECELVGKEFVRVTAIEWKRALIITPTLKFDRIVKQLANKTNTNILERSNCHAIMNGVGDDSLICVVGLSELATLVESKVIGEQILKSLTECDVFGKNFRVFIAHQNGVDPAFNELALKRIERLTGLESLPLVGVLRHVGGGDIDTIISWLHYSPIRPTSHFTAAHLWWVRDPIGETETLNGLHFASWVDPPFLEWEPETDNDTETTISTIKPTKPTTKVWLDGVNPNEPKRVSKTITVKRNEREEHKRIKLVRREARRGYFSGVVNQLLERMPSARGDRRWATFLLEFLHARARYIESKRPIDTDYAIPERPAPLHLSKWQEDDSDSSTIIIPNGAFVNILGGEPITRLAANVTIRTKLEDIKSDLDKRLGEINSEWTLVRGWRRFNLNNLKRKQFNKLRESSPVDTGFIEIQLKTHDDMTYPIYDPDAASDTSSLYYYSVPNTNPKLEQWGLKKEIRKWAIENDITLPVSGNSSSSDEVDSDDQLDVCEHEQCSATFVGEFGQVSIPNLIPNPGDCDPLPHWKWFNPISHQTGGVYWRESKCFSIHEHDHYINQGLGWFVHHIKDGKTLVFIGRKEIKPM